MAKVWNPLATLTLSATQVSATFSNIPGTYRDLYVVVSGQMNGSNGAVRLQFNGDTGNNYYCTILEGTGTGGLGTYGYSAGSQPAIYTAGNSYPFSGSQNSVVTAHILDYAQTTKHKTALVHEGNGTTGGSLTSGRWANTAAITSVTIYAGTSTNNFVSGTTLALYGVTA